MFVQVCLIIYIVSALISTLECNGIVVISYPLNMEKIRNYYQNEMGCLSIFSILENNIHPEFQLKILKLILC
jgi:hypothetical protein